MHIGIIGFGNIATALIGLVASFLVSHVTVLVRPGSEEAPQRRLQSSVGPDVDIVSSFSDLLTAIPDLVVECAGHSAVASYPKATFGHSASLVSTDAAQSKPSGRLGDKADDLPRAGIKYYRPNDH